MATEQNQENAGQETPSLTTTHTGFFRKAENRVKDEAELLVTMLEGDAKKVYLALSVRISKLEADLKAALTKHGIHI